MRNQGDIIASNHAPPFGTVCGHRFKPALVWYGLCVNHCGCGRFCMHVNHVHDHAWLDVVVDA
jgi:hypothetical protein